jgi:signal transduction histidine kinase
MTRRAAALIGWTLFGLSAVLATSTVVFLFLNHDTSATEVFGPRALDVGFEVSFVAFAGVGAVVMSRMPRHAIGWIFSLSAAASTVWTLAHGYALYALRTNPGNLPNGRIAAWIASWTPALAIGPIFLFLLLLFPTGQLPSRRWRPAAWLGAFAISALSVSGMVLPGPLDQRLGTNPFGVAALKGTIDVVQGLGWTALLVGTLASATSLVIRFRRSRGEERQQIKWLATAGMLVAVGFVGVASSSGSGAANTAFNAVFFLGFVAVPVAAAVAIFKYRLYGIDVVINKTVVYALLAGFITAVYVAIVVGIGALIGQGTSKPNLGLSILATAVVAVAFQPVRQRVQKLANRLVYGQRATPYEVLSEFSSRMAHSYEREDLLHRMARILAEGAGARTAVVWLMVGDELKPVSAWPLDDLPPSAVALPSAGLPDLAGTLSLPVHHQGELLGALSLTKPPEERLTPAEEHLARDLASGAGLVLRNVRLTEELLARLDELRASRQRIVAASDSERRRLERNIHDGAQQQLVALAVKTRLARSLLAKDPARASAMLSDVEREVAQALEDIRDLARGIYPSLLAERGLEAALRAQAGRAPFPVEVQAAGVRRHDPGLEAAVYFCCLEALQNVGKYAGASSATIRLAEADGRLVFEVEDDGAGFDPGARGYGTGLQGMADRLAAEGGELEVRSSPGAGTTVTGRLPARSLEPVA